MVGECGHSRATYHILRTSSDDPTVESSPTERRMHFRSWQQPALRHLLRTNPHHPYLHTLIKLQSFCATHTPFHRFVMKQRFSSLDVKVTIQFPSSDLSTLMARLHRSLPTNFPRLYVRSESQTSMTYPRAYFSSNSTSQIIANSSS